MYCSSCRRSASLVFGWKVQSFMASAITAARSCSLRPAVSFCLQQAFFCQCSSTSLTCMHADPIHP
jgi:hypothetical protein